jgi:LuxR family glucitol operon transcriptional activator
MSLIQVDLFGWLPDSLKQQIIDSVVTFVADQARKVLGEEMSQALQRLRSDAAFQDAVDRGLKEATDRFVREYTVEDEDLVAAIARDPDFWKAESVRGALLEIVRHPGVYLAEERMALTRNFADVLCQRVNRQRVDRAVTFYLRCVAESLWHLEPLRPVYELQIQRLSVERATEMVQELRWMRADVQEAMMALVQTIGEQQKLLAAPDRTALPEPKKVYHNLPQPDYGTFIGREKELAQVHSILRPYPHSQHALVTIDGIGGIGKSALALEVAHRYLRDYDRLPPEERFEAIIWISAKAAVLTADGIAPRQQITRTLEDIYTRISVTLEREDITRARPEDQDELVTKALTQQRTLLIVDNLETVDDERVNAFLRELPAPTKAIVTTRHRIDVAYPVRLTGMPKEDGLALIAQERAKKDVTLTEAKAEKLYERTGGVPLAMVWSVAQMGYGYSVEAVLRRLGQPSEDIARYCFEGAMEHIRGKPAHKLLMALSLFATDASREALGYVADLPELDRDEGLVALEKLSLLNRQAGRFSLLPLTRSYVAHEFEQIPESAQAAFGRMLAYYKQLVTPPIEVQVGDPYWDGWLNYGKAQDLEQEWGNLDHVIRWALDERYYDAALDLFLPIVHFLARWGLWDERLQLSREMCRVANALGDYSSEAWLWIDAIGWILRERQQFSEGINALKAGRLLAHQFNLPDALILADAFEAGLYFEVVDSSLARKKIESALQQLDLDSVLERGTPVRRIVARRVVSTAALVSLSTGDMVRAKELHERALELRLSVGGDITPELSNLAHVSLLLEDTAAAEKFLVQALASAGQKDVVWINYELAVVAEQKGELREARRLCKLALEQFAQLGVQRGVQHCQQLLARLQE